MDEYPDRRKVLLGADWYSYSSRLFSIRKKLDPQHETERQERPLRLLRAPARVILRKRAAKP